MTKIYSLLRIHVSYKTDIRYSLPIKSSKFSAIYTITAFFSVKLTILQSFSKKYLFSLDLASRVYNGWSFSKHKSLYAAGKLRLKAYVKRTLRSAA